MAKTYTVSVDQLIKALEEAGMVFDHKAADEAIAKAASQLADEIDEEVFQALMKNTAPTPFVHEYYEAVADPKALWEKLKVLEPYDSGSSLHVAEERYELDGVKYVAYFVIGDPSEIPEICTIKEFKR